MTFCHRLKVKMFCENFNVSRQHLFWQSGSDLAFPRWKSRRSSWGWKSWLHMIYHFPFLVGDINLALPAKTIPIQSFSLCPFTSERYSYMSKCQAPSLGKILSILPCSRVFFPHNCHMEEDEILAKTFFKQVTFRPRCEAMHHLG